MLNKNLSEKEIDVLMCVGSKDVNYLFLHSLKALIKNFLDLETLIIVTNVPKLVEEKIKEKISFDNLYILDDREILKSSELSMHGWYRQQIVKLRANSVCKTEFYCCLGADTIILKPISKKNLVDSNGAILYFNRYSEPTTHLEYERKRVEAVSKILQTEPNRSFMLGDFIMDFMTFDKKIIKSLHQYLESLYGQDFFSTILSGREISPYDKQLFGEWTLYAIYVLDVLSKNITIRNSQSLFLRQIHNSRVLKEFEFDSYIVHFVDKNFDVDYIFSRLKNCGLYI